MKELLLIRHGESEHHLNGITGGWTNSPLTELGRRQAALTGRRLSTQPPFKPSAIFSSDLTRAAETTSIIAEALGLEVQHTPHLRELNNGIAAGLSNEQAKRIQIPPTEPMLDWVPYPQAESWRAMYQRVSGFLSTLRADKADALILVSHANAIICMINWFLGLESDDNLRYVMYEIRPCSITHLRITEDGSRVVVRLSDTEHLLAP